MPTWEEIFSSRDEYNMQLLIEVSGGTYLTNTEIGQESFKLTEMLSDSTDLKFGGCNSAQFQLRIRSSVTDMTGKVITVKQYAYTDADIRIVVQGGVPVSYNTRTGTSSALGNDYYQYGIYKVRTDKPTPDKDYRDISAFDSLERVINVDVAEWYNNLYAMYDKVSLKFLREAILDYFEIPYDSFTGVNDSVAVGKTITTTTISAVSILRAICELNGCFGYIGRDGKFKCKVLDTTTTVKEYDRYKQGQINYQDALANVITQIRIFSDISKADASIGVAGNSYIINDNVLLYGKDNDELEAIATSLMPVMSACAYRPFSCVTYGDPCVELGDFIEIPTVDKTVEAFLLYRELTGTQNLLDKLEAKGEEVNGSGNTGSSAVISQLNSQMSQVKDETDINYYLFRSATALNIGDSDNPTRVARIRYATSQETVIAVEHEFKMDVDFSTGSDRCKVYATYYHDGQLIEYQPIETYAIDDYHTWDLYYAFKETEAGYHTWEVFLSTVGGDATIAINDASITLNGQGINTEESWDGTLEAEDVITAVFGGGFTVNITDTPSVTTKPVEPITEPEDVITAIFGGGFTVSVSEDIRITQTMVFSNWVDDTDDNIVDDEGDAIIFMGID